MLRYLSFLLVLLALIVSAACGSNGDNADFGPLAVIDATGGSLALGGTGPIDIGDNCVTIVQSNGNVLSLVWHSAEVRWNGKDREIDFDNGRDPPLTIRDSDTVTVGGETLYPEDAPVERNLVWLATPNESCNGEQFAVSSVTKP